MHVFTLASGALEARILDYGATLMSLSIAGVDVILGFDDPERYRGPHPHFGGTIGRYANRIANGRFALEGRTYQLARNHGAHHLHGGLAGFDRVQWRGVQQGAALALHYTSPDGEEGYPGTLEVTVTYTVEDTALTIGYAATTDQPTIVNLTNHAYFNLAGAGAIDAHVLHIPAERYLPVDDALIPTGAIQPVVATPMDFRTPRPIGGAAIDHTFVLDGTIELVDPSSGRGLQITTTQPGVQLYTGNLLDGSVAGKGGMRYAERSALCLEPHHFPNSPNEPAFPSTALRPGEHYRQRTRYTLKG